ncbi:MAG TPA: hypothetical protein V6D35_08360 [Candidatus Sericytochromatia bacterium]|jgi:hypothetical protein
MKPELQRIETALHQLKKPQSSNSQTTSASVEHQTDPVAQQSGRKQTAGEPSFSMAVQPFPASKHQVKTPTLPKLKPLNISEHRHAANPALAMNLLQEIQEIVARWQEELQTIVRQIQDIYIEGPIVDGWLESHARDGKEAPGTVRPAEGDRLMDYVEEVWNQPDAKVTLESPRTGYRLCGLDASGQFWARPCPPDQVPSVSLAIARHQKLRQLLNRKQELETRLSQLAETLIVMHSHLSKD